MWGQSTLILSSLSPKRDWGPKRVKLLAAVSTDCSHPSIILAPATSLSMLLFVVPIISNTSENCYLVCILGHVFLELFAFSFYLYSIYSSSVHFPTSPMFDNSRLLAVCPCSTLIRSSYVRCAYMHFRFLTTSIFYHYEAKDRAFSLLYALFNPFWLCLFLLCRSTNSCRYTWTFNNLFPIIILC